MSRALLSASALVTSLALIPAPVAAHPPDAGTLETVVAFDPTLLETPENLEADRHGNVYVSLGFNGEVRKIAPDGTATTVAVFPIGPPLTFCGVFFNAVGSIASDVHGNLYTTVLACDPENRGIWRVHPDGELEILGTTPLTGLPNGIAYDRGWVYASDTFLSVIWRVPEDGLGGAPAEVWIEHPLLAPPGPGLPGANGVQIFRHELYVANSGAGTIVAIPIQPDGSAGEPRVHATLPTGGCDDFAFDVHGAIYCTTAITNTLVRIDPDGTTEVLLTAADGLDIPTAAAFGRRGQGKFDLYITNAAFFVDPAVARPSLMRLHLGVPGAP